MSKTTGAEGTNISDSTGATTGGNGPSLPDRIKKLEDTVAAMESKMAHSVPVKGNPNAEADPDGTACMNEALKAVKTLAASVETKLKEFAANQMTMETMGKTIAKEFAAVTGVSATVKTDGAGASGDTRAATASTASAGASGSAKAFADLVAKKFAECKSKVTAVKQAMIEDEAGYRAFRDSGLNIKYS